MLSKVIINQADTVNLKNIALIKLYSWIKAKLSEIPRHFFALGVNIHTGT